MPRGHHYSPAALKLMRAGVTLTRLAAALDTTPPTVSRWLRGEHPAPAELFGAIAAYGGRDLADAVAAAIPAREAVSA